MPFPPGVCRIAEELEGRDGAGKAVPIQAAALDRWADGSLRWVLLDFQRETSHGDVVYLTWSRRTTEMRSPGIAIRTAAAEIRVETGAAEFHVRPGGGFPLAGVTIGGRDVLSDAGPFLQIEADRGPAALTWREIRVEETGAIRSAVAAVGRADLPDGAQLDICARLHFFAGSSVVRAVVTVRNPARADHPGGYWELGDPGSVLLRDVALSLGAATGPDGAVIRCSPERHAPFERFPEPFEIYQDSSGGENWASANHVNRAGRNPGAFRGYRLVGGSTTRTGLRATPLVGLACRGVWLAATTPHFWQNFPKAFEARDGRLAVRLWPGQYGDLHELQGGEQKTHVIYLGFGQGDMDPSDLEWCRSPTSVGADPSWYCGSGVVSGLTPASEDSSREYLRLASEALDGDSSFERKRETIDEYGWRHFGDLYADHEAAFHQGPSPLVSHYNNQYDAIAAFGCHFMRTGDPRWRRLMEELAAHVIDIDLYHTDRDKAAYNGGLFWHTAHYLDAGRSTHRSFPRSPLTSGGGPGGEHNYSSGLALHYYLSGDAAARDAAIGLGRWVLGMDAANGTVFRWLSRSDTGLASATVTPDYHGPGRGPANSVNALLDAHRLTGEQALLDKAEQLIRRCIHPGDDIDARDLLNAESRWSYVVFLQMLGRFLEYKRERGAVDGMWSYARESLLAYARWMLEHESPYLHRAGTLEFPNETWAAQDLRKGDVFGYAARCTAGSERDAFRERSLFFFEYALSTLSASPHRARTRPLVLALAHGYRHAALRTGGVADEDFSFPAAPAFPTIPERFVPQRRIAERRLAAAAIAAASVGAVAALAYFLR